MADVPFVVAGQAGRRVILALADGAAPPGLTNQKGRTRLTGGGVGPAPDVG